MFKNVIDRVFAAVALVILSPLLLVLACAIGFRMGRPVLFRQTRIGCRERPFTSVKFRTMTDARNSSGTLLHDASRLTALGHFLRTWSLDELPQLWNVVRGDMKFVGPRPLLPEYLPRYSAQQRRRHEVMPGITGWAQIHGRNKLSWEERLELDVWYVAHRSIWLDMRILALTVWKVIRREGISHVGHATMPEFSGPQNRNAIPSDRSSS
jgi:lipopolysaccharide/colanic/teichoic acid biosynthesis glycosyltransferase